ncbi:flagellar basal body L-ring protein FlgH [Endozoicomonas sp. 4G]|uniref:flagellar basal body L-ring protein FlgH n=1 Tax=Endozoicomonas sp. 4G TaxID=2872754 RepID=UPI0020790345|nr:flagellar basal body L-ring protein FlgH [Endozoicomonas sp. 4G]
MKRLCLITVILLSGCTTAARQVDTQSAAKPQQVAEHPEPEMEKAVAEGVAEGVAEAVAEKAVLKKKAPHSSTVYPSGSLFNANYGHFMFSDRRAYRLGDILTIELEGTTNVSMSGLSKVDKNNAISIPDPTLLGRSSADIVGGIGSLAFDIQPSRSYGGNTSASRGNSLKGNIAVKVVEVFSNGTLRVEGEKWLTINSGKELIKISGLVRPEDIKTDNKVSSERLAEAKIDYVALGINSDAHEPGWVSKILNSPWFPF